MSASPETVFITGASTGIGRAAALAFSAKGYRVMAAVRKQADADSLQAAGLGRLNTILYDVTKADQLDEVKRTLKDWTGGKGLSVLVNNAGLNYNAPFEYTDEASARYMMEVNFFGLYKTSQALIPLLRKHAQTTGRTARLLNIGSIGSIIGLPLESFYHASKFAVLGLTESIRYELKPQNVYATAILPGGVRTEFTSKTSGSIQASMDVLPGDGQALYGEPLSKMMATTRTVENSSFLTSSEQAAKRIVSIAGLARPRLQYLIGADARFLYAMARLLPFSWRHGLLGRFAGL